jgi:phosphoesterase RecJ-like protein
LLNIDQINSAKHIVISLADSADYELITSSNALYSYILSLHKKVSLYAQELDEIKRFSFLPWIDKFKDSYPLSADLNLELSSSDDVFDFFETNSLKLNPKIATSLYASLLAKTDGFKTDVDGMTFAWAKKLVEAGAETKKCARYILNYNSLASLRLKSLLLSKMILLEDGRVASIQLLDSDLKSSGTTAEDAKIVIEDALSLPTVNRVIVKYKNKEIINKGDRV